MTEFRDTRVPASPCPYCGKRLDSAMAADPQHPDATPDPGDLSICISCASPLVFTAKLTLRKPFPGEIPQGPVRYPAFDRAVRAMRALDRRDMKMD
jgi:hypothetical protein